MAVSFIVSDDDAQKIGPQPLRLIAEAFQSHFDLPDLQVELSLASPEDIQELNKAYRQLDEPTDVLSFQLLGGLDEIGLLPRDASVLLGSIIICPEKVAAYEETLPQMVEHGLLHLLGLDHEVDLDAWQVAERPVLEILEGGGLSIPEVPRHD